MKISIKSQDEKREVSITCEEDIDIYEMAEELTGLLIAWGFAPESVKEILPDED